MRGRWGSVESLEKIFFNARNHIGAVFHSAFGKLVQKKEAKKAAKKRGKDVGQDEDEKFKEEQRQYRKAAINATNSWGFTVFYSIGHISKLPLTKFMNWHMKEVKAFNKLVLEAKKKGQTYLGPTPLSKIVTCKGEAVANEFSALLGPAAWKDPDLLGSIMHEIPADLKETAIRLHVLLVTQAASGWNFRIMVMIKSFPLLLIFLVIAVIAVITN